MAEKIQQSFILHLQNWIGLIQPPFHMLQADSSEEEPFRDLVVNIYRVGAEQGLT